MTFSRFNVQLNDAPVLGHRVDGFVVTCECDGRHGQLVALEKPLGRFLGRDTDFIRNSTLEVTH